MTGRFRKVIGLAAVSAACVAVVASSGPAQAVNAAPARPGVPANPQNVYIETEFGNHNRVGADNLNAGTAVKQVSSAAGRILDMVDKGNDSNGNPLKRIDFSNNNVMAANNACDGVTIKNDPNATGTIWVLYPAPDGHLYLIPRACNNGDYDKRMGADNVIGHQWEIKGSPPPAGFYEKIVLDVS